MLIREYRVDITQRAIDLADNKSEELNALSLALIAKYGEGSKPHIYNEFLIMEFPNNVLMFAMGSDCKRFWKRLKSGEVLEPEDVHIWRAVTEPRPVSAMQPQQDPEPVTAK